MNFKFFICFKEKKIFANNFLTEQDYESIKNIIIENFKERKYNIERLNDEFINYEISVIVKHINKKYNPSQHMTKFYSDVNYQKIKNVIGDKIVKY